MKTTKTKVKQEPFGFELKKLAHLGHAHAQTFHFMDSLIQFDWSNFNVYFAIDLVFCVQNVKNANFACWLKEKYANLSKNTMYTLAYIKWLAIFRTTRTVLSANQ